MSLVVSTLRDKRRITGPTTSSTARSQAVRSILEGCHLTKPLRLIAALVMEFHVRKMRLHPLDHFVERHDAGRRLVVTIAGVVGAAADQPISHRRRFPVFGRPAGFIKKEQEGHVVGEDYHLPGRRMC